MPGKPCCRHGQSKISAYVVGVNRVGNDAQGLQYNGDSMVVDPMGEIQYQSAGKEDVFTCTLDKEKLGSPGKISFLERPRIIL